MLKIQSCSLDTWLELRTHGGTSLVRQSNIQAIEESKKGTVVYVNDQSILTRESYEDLYNCMLTGKVPDEL